MVQLLPRNGNNLPLAVVGKGFAREAAGPFGRRPTRLWTFPLNSLLRRHTALSASICALCRAVEEECDSWKGGKSALPSRRSTAWFRISRLSALHNWHMRLPRPACIQSRYRAQSRATRRNNWPACSVNCQSLRPNAALPATQS